QIFKYREHVDDAMALLLIKHDPKLTDLILLGLNHEQQHQELLYSDIKYILGHNPLFPAYSKEFDEYKISSGHDGFSFHKKSIHRIGYRGTGFCFDNEKEDHEVLLGDFSISTAL